jgi:hypothetical protein
VAIFTLEISHLYQQFVATTALADKEKGAALANAAVRLGDGTTTMRLTPVMVSGLSNGRSISAGSGHTCAVLTNDMVYCWGQNGKGERAGNLEYAWQRQCPTLQWHFLDQAWNGVSSASPPPYLMPTAK